MEKQVNLLTKCIIMYYEDNYVLFHGEKYFVNGCQNKTDADGNTISVCLDVYNLTSNATVFSVTESSATECVEMFEKAAIWDGKTFWKAEGQIQWVDD